MLRLLTLVLVLANAVYFAWTQGYLADAGFAPISQAEPQRVAQQIRPEAMQLLTPAEARQAERASAPVAGNTPGSSAPPPAPECLQAGLFNDAQAERLRTRLETALPTGSWSLAATTEPGRWIIYMGKYANEEALVKKRGELRALGQSTEPLMVPWLNPGLSLGHYGSAAEAERELARAATRGVRTARVMVEKAEVSGQLLRLATVDAALKTKLNDIRPQLEGKPLQPCR